MTMRSKNKTTRETTGVTIETDMTTMSTSIYMGECDSLYCSMAQ